MKIGIFGSIGVGKTTLAEHLREKYNAKNVSEPVDENPYLKLFYENPKDYALRAQLFFLISRYNTLLFMDSEKDLIIFDRTFLEDYAFASTQHKLGSINDIDFKLYNDYYDLMKKHMANMDIIFYLYADISTLLKRIIERNRSYEKKITVEYMEALNNSYNELYEKLVKEGINIIKVDWDSKFDRPTVYKYIDEILNKN